MRKVLLYSVTAISVAGLALVLVSPPWAGAQGGGTIEADVKYSGPPVAETLKITKDVEQCGQEQKIEKVAVGPNKGLASAVVSVPTAKGGGPAKKVVLDQKGCKFVPSVVATVPGDVDIGNSDGILHNIHTYSSANPTVNKAQPKFKKVMTEKFEKPEYVKVTCDVHSWMVGWIAVMPTGYFAVSDTSGAAKIENVPAGKQTVEVWHPTAGKQTREVDVKAGQTTKVTFEIAAK